MHMIFNSNYLSSNWLKLNNIFMKSNNSYFFILILLLISSQAISSDELNNEKNEHPVIGLVLSGGGARGAAHIGVLKVLEDMHVPIDVITGTSMGAVVGGLYAYGYAPDEIERLLEEVDWDELFIDKPPRSQLNYRRKQDDSNYLIKLESGFKEGKIIIPTGLIQGQKLNLLLKSLTLSAPKNFDLLPIRFRAVAADIETGEVVVMGEGELSTAIRASLSIPGIFSPVEWNNRLLVDGGFANNIPVQLAKDLGADILIVVDLSSDPRQRNELSSPFSIINQTLGFQILKNSAEQLKILGSEDILIQPDMGKYSSTDFNSATQMVDNGILATKLVIPRLKQLSLSESDYTQHQYTIRQRTEPVQHIDKVVISNQSVLGDDIIKSHINIKPGDELNLASFEHDLSKLYGLNIFKSVDYEIEKESEDTSLLVKTEEKDWGPNYLRFGMNFESDFAGSSKFNVTARHTRTPINASGGEWQTEIQVGHDQRISTELYQPLDENLLYFVNSKASYSTTHYARYESGELAADYIVSSSQYVIGAGRLLGNWGAFTLGVSTGHSDIHPYIGDLSVSKSDTNTGAWYASYNYDQIDSLNFPKNGTLSSISWLGNRKSLGSEVEQDSIAISLLSARSSGKNTFILWSGLGGIVDSEIPTQSGFALGGFFSLSGYENSELVGRYAGVLRLIYLREINSSKSALKIPIYIGGSLETGNVWNDRKDIRSDSLLTAGSLSIAFDTPLGPLYLARGFAQNGRSKYYMFLGRSFTFF